MECSSLRVPRKSFDIRLLCFSSLSSHLDLLYLQARFNPALLTLLSSTCSPTPFPRIRYSEALLLLQKAKVKWEFEPTWENGLQSEHEKWIAEVKFKR
jgi:asparaginyl-tRNA synthetase